MSGVGERGGQLRLSPNPGHPYWHFNLTHSAVTIERGAMIFASGIPISNALLQKNSTDFIENILLCSDLSHLSAFSIPEAFLPIISSPRCGRKCRFLLRFQSELPCPH